ncbi:MAG: hypothetical protein ACJA2W_000147 [Planctomycetota bacterium]|jgi:hypothetical protein
MQSLIARAVPLALLLAAAAPLAAADVGAALPTPEFDELKQTAATSFEDFTGRVVLVEFFEHW